MKISLCMIVKNEEAVLGRCLESAAELVDEVVIVDTGSTDGTVNVAKKFTDKIFYFEWQDNFAKARNYAFSKASGDYLMWLDADDVIEDREAFRRLFLRVGQERPDVVMLPYNVGFDGERVTLSYPRERIIKAGVGLEFVGAVHEAIPPRGKIMHDSAAVFHRKMSPNEPGRNLRIYQKQISEGAELSPRDHYYYARELATSGCQKMAEKEYEKCALSPEAWPENRVSAAFELSQLLRESDPERSDFWLGRALLLGEPRADVVCEAGRRALERGDLGAARLWYRLAPGQFRRPLGGFVSADFGALTPFLQLCVIADRQGDRGLAERYNALAARVASENRAVKWNMEYFRRIREQLGDCGE